MRISLWVEFPIRAAHELADRVTDAFRLLEPFAKDTVLRQAEYPELRPARVRARGMKAWPADECFAHAYFARSLLPKDSASTTNAYFVVREPISA